MKLRRYTVEVDQDRYVNDTPIDGGFVRHLDGVDWFNATTPPRWHKCWPQTQAFLHHQFISRCACGATRIGFTDQNHPWIERNSRGRES